MTSHTHGRRASTDARRGAPIRKVAAVLTALSATALVLLGTAGRADAAGPQPITDFTNYPAPLPSGCPSGGGALSGLSFDNGRGVSASSLRDLDVRHGDTVTMSWNGFASACKKADGSANITVGLAAYDNPTLQFDETVDEVLQDGWAACGVDANPCSKSANGRYELRVSLPGAGEMCNVQLDAFLGLPLAIVGPSGNFYSDFVRGGGTNRLISANNFGLEPCVPPTTTAPSPAPPSTAPSTTATPPTTDTTVAPPTTTETSAAPPSSTVVTGPSEAPDTTPTPELVTVPAQPVLPSSTTSTSTSTTSTVPVNLQTKVLSESVNASLPFTGANTLSAVQAALLLCGVGAVSLAAAGLLRRRRITG